MRSGVTTAGIFGVVLLATGFAASASAGVPIARVGLTTIAAESNGQYVNGTTSAIFGRATASASWKDGFLDLSGGPYPSVSASASFAGGGYSTPYVTQGFAWLTYYFTVISLNGGPVPITFGGLSKLSQAGVGGAVSTLDVANDQGLHVAGALFGCAPTANDCGFTSFLAQADFLSYHADINGLFSGSVTISALADAYADYGANSSSAYIDPYISIDQAYLDANPGTLLIISPGIGNSPSTVPEPLTWLMMVIGFAAAGVAMRQSKTPRSMSNA